MICPTCNIPEEFCPCPNVDVLTNPPDLTQERFESFPLLARFEVRRGPKGYLFEVTGPGSHEKTEATYALLDFFNGLINADQKKEPPKVKES